VTASVAIAAACSGTSHPPAAQPATTSTIAPTTTASVPTTTTSTLPPAPSSTSVSTTNGVVTISGSGDLTVPLPASVPLPAIVHAHHDGTASFVVSATDSFAHRTAVLAGSLGAYDGTFPVGFVDPANDPTVSLRIATRGPWRIDIGRAKLAHVLETGVAGVGDNVLSYLGPAATAHITYAGHSTLIVNMYEGGGPVTLVHMKGPYDGPISLLTGPAFIAVTTSGKWSMIIG
jgi:hypothetical protein